MKQSLESAICDEIKAGFEKIPKLLRSGREVNYYRVTERLLRSYPKLKKLVMNPDDYGFIPPERSKSISVAPPPGSGLRDREDALQDAINARISSFDMTQAQFNVIDAVVRLFEDRPEFIIIRMYYFGEDALGNYRPDDAKPYTFDDIAQELSGYGAMRSEKTLRIWRTKLVQDMTVVMFGVDGAISVEMREPPHAT